MVLNKSYEVEKDNDVSIPYFPIVACFSGEYVFFVAYNDSRIFRMDVNGENIEALCRVPVRRRNAIWFSTMYCYNNKLILFPMSETGICIVDLNTKCVKVINLPWDKEQSNAWKYRKPYIKGNKAWIVTRIQAMVIEFNMDTHNICIIDTWPEDISFEKDEIKFYSVYGDEQYLYMFRCSSNMNVRMDLKTHCMEKWFNDYIMPYTVVKKDKMYTVPVTYDSAPYYVVSDKITGEIIQKEIIEMQEYEIRANYHWYNPLELDEYIYFVPHEEGNLLKIDTRTDKISGCEIEPSNYVVRNNTKHKYSSHEIIDIGKKLLIVPFNNNCFVFVNKETNEISYKQVFISSELYQDELQYNRMAKKKILHETEADNLDKFLLLLKMDHFDK